MPPEKSPVRDKRIITLAAEVAESRDRRIPGLLLRLKPILDSAAVGSSDGTRLRREIWDYQLLDVLILVIRQDFSVVEGQWHSAARLTSILSQAVSGLDLPRADLKDVTDHKLPDAINNMFLVARRIQARFVQIPKKPSKEQERSFLLGTFKTVLESITFMASGYISLTQRVLGSPWLLQLLISDNTDTVNLVMDLVQKVLRANWVAIKEINIKTLYSIMDELIYKLSMEQHANTGVGAVKCVLCICEYHKPMVAMLSTRGAVKCVLCICEYHKPMVSMLSTRYRGLRLLLSRWENMGFPRDLKALHRLIDAGNAQRAEMEKNYDMAMMIQANWRGFIARKKLARANKAFAKFQKAFKNRLKLRESTLSRKKNQSDAEYKGLLNRQRIMREFRERQLHCIEILPAAKVESYLQNEKIQAAVKIQKLWRGYSDRTQLPRRRDLARRTRAAIRIQQCVRRWLERVDARKGQVPISLRPPGLTDERRVELNKEIHNHREENPPVSLERADLEKVHLQAAQLLARYFNTRRQSRKDQQKREALIARLDTDSELCSLAPPLDHASNKDVEMYSSRSVPVATKARVSHMETLRTLQLPWWKKLGDEFHDPEVPEEEVYLF